MLIVPVDMQSRLTGLKSGVAFFVLAFSLDGLRFDGAVFHRLRLFS